MKRFSLGILLILTIVLSLVECQRWNSYNGRTSSNGRKAPRNGDYYAEETNVGKPAEVNNNSPVKSQPVKQSSRGGIGAWGYVSIVLFIILSGIGIYYTVIFYPIVCKKQRMYHVMGSTTV